MAISEKFVSDKPTWCPGCGNFGIRQAFTDAVSELGLEPHQLTIVSGIGQASKFPHYVRCNAFNGLHGRPSPVATGMKLANPDLHVFVNAGDGDCYGEGGNHFIHAIRRNIDVKLLVHNNQLYALTKGQASPTSDEGMVTKNQPFGVMVEAFNPLAVAIALDCSLVARSYSGDHDHLVQMIKLAFEHKGFSVLDILQPCVTFNHLNTFKWYRERVYPLEEGYDPRDRAAAFQRSLEWGERIPIGVLYRNDRPTLEERQPALKEGRLAQDDSFRQLLPGTLDGFR